MALLGLHKGRDFRYTSRTTRAAPEPGAASSLQPLEQVGQAEQFRYAPVGPTSRKDPERIRRRRIRPRQRHGEQVPFGVQPVHALVAPTPTVPDQRERLT
jgi:hypothetical protein